MISWKPNNIKSAFLLAIFLLLGSVYSNAQEENYAIAVEKTLDSANLFQNQNKVATALQTIDRAVKLAEKSEDPRLLLTTYQEAAEVFLDFDDQKTALIYADLAASKLRDLEYPTGDATQKYISAYMLFLERNYFQASDMLALAKELNNDRNLRNKVQLLEAQIYLRRSKFQEAETLFNALMVNSDPKERAYFATKANLGLVELKMEQEKYESALSNAEAAINLANKNGFTKEKIIANTQLAQLYENLGQYEEALAQNKKFTKFKDSLYNPNQIKQEYQLAGDIRVEHFTNEIGKLDQEIQKLSESVNRSEITAILTSAFLIIISLLATSLFRNNQIKLKTNDLLQTKNKELEIARDSAVSAMQAKTNFLSTVTHELRTPLYAVTGLTHLLLEEDPEEHQKEHLKSLKFSGDYLLNFINDILQINKIDADKLEPLNIDFKLRKVLTDVVSSLQQKAAENDTKIELSYDDTIPRTLKGDPIKISQIFMNLVGNALKFTKGGIVTVITKNLKEAEGHITLYMEVKDDGIGISKEQQATIFESFEQGSVQINREYGGTGLGLTIVKSLLGLFDSTIKLKSELGKGSSFFFEMKLQIPTELAEESELDMEEEDYEFKGLHVLVVEDNKINQVITSKMLNKKEISCDIANNGYEAVDSARVNNYDAILMDIHMPGISGEEATRQIREFDKDIPIIALTAISLDDSVDSFYAAGCNDVVTKPFKPEVFYQKIGENIFKKKPDA